LFNQLLSYMLLVYSTFIPGVG